MKTRGLDNFEFESLGRYFREIGHLKPLKKSEEAELMKKGDKKSLDELICRNLKYVVSVANRYKGCGMALSDLINEGNIGLVRAAMRFDYKRDVKFITYAIWWIRQSIIHALANNAGPVRLPIKQADTLFKIEKFYKSFSQQHHRDPTTDEIAEELKLKIKDVEVILRVYHTELSLDNLIKGSKETSYLDLLEAPVRYRMEEDLIHQSLIKEIDEMVAELPPREKMILEMRFGFKESPMTLNDIGKKMGISRERVRQLENRAKKRLINSAKNMALEEYLD